MTGGSITVPFSDSATNVPLTPASPATTHDDELFRRVSAGKDNTFSRGSILSPAVMGSGTAGSRNSASMLTMRTESVDDNTSQHSLSGVPSGHASSRHASSHRSSGLPTGASRTQVLSAPASVVSSTHSSIKSAPWNNDGGDES